DREVAVRLAAQIQSLEFPNALQCRVLVRFERGVEVEGGRVAAVERDAEAGAPRPRLRRRRRWRGRGRLRLRLYKRRPERCGNCHDGEHTNSSFPHTRATCTNHAAPRTTMSPRVPP